MIKLLANSQSSSWVLKYNDVRSIIITVIFVGLDISIPNVFHHFHLAGPTFLPMHIFVLLGGLLFGLRAGLIIGLFTPLVSYSLSGMPALNILLQTVVELSVYGLAAGVLRERLHLNAFVALFGAMLAGRLALLLVVSMLGIWGTVYSPAGFEANSVDVVWSAIKQGWPGMVIQLICIPLIVFFFENRLAECKTN